jgi:P27 family predicted phage terminase small subunit
MVMKQRGRLSAAQQTLDLVHPRPPGERARLAFDPPQPPPHLGKPERQIWDDIFKDYELESRASVAVLATALEAHQRARECREIILRDGPTVTGRDGQLRVHPLLAVERDARAAWLTGLKTLGLDL